MSNEVTAACRKLQMPPTAKAVLMALADFASDSGECWPSIPTICEWTCFGERAVHGAIKWLEQHAALAADRSNGRHTRYTVKPDAFTGGAVSEQNYVYRITHVPTGRFYVGLRTCVGSPETDDYFGSGAESAWFRANRADCRKDIVQVFATRQAAAEAESLLILASIGDDRCANKRVSSPLNPGGNPRSKCAPQEMRPAANAVEPPQEMRQPPQQMQSPPQEMRSNHQEPSRTIKKATTNKARSANACPTSIKSIPVPKMPDDVNPQIWSDWVSLRKAKSSPITETVLKSAQTESAKAGLSLNAFLEIWCSRGSVGLFAEWLKPNERAGPSASRPSAAANFKETRYESTPENKLPEYLRNAVAAGNG